MTNTASDNEGGTVAKVKLHRCPCLFVKIQAHACWRVQSALNEQSIEYEVVKEPMSRGKRADVERLSHQRLLPVIEFEDGSVYRESSKDMRARILAGRLFAGRQSDAPSPLPERDS